MKRAEGKMIKVEWCENWIKSKFAKLPSFATGFEASHFFDMAEKAGLWVRGTYGSPMSEALERLTIVEAVHDENGSFMYHAFRLAK